MSKCLFIAFDVNNPFKAAKKKSSYLLKLTYITIVSQSLIFKDTQMIHLLTLTEYNNSRVSEKEIYFKRYFALEF